MRNVYSRRPIPLTCTVAAGLLFLSPTLAKAENAFPAPPDAAVFEPIEDNPYFVQDPNDPRVLLPAPGALERGIDRGYVEKMARPPIDPALLDKIEAAQAGQVFSPPSLSQLHDIDVPSLPRAAAVVNGNIIVIEGDSNTVAQTDQGMGFNHNGGLQYIISDVWRSLGDNFDFITVVTSFDDQGVAAYYMPLRQDVTGLGDCNFNQGKTFGCVFDQLGGAQLQGFVFMNSLNYWRSWDRNSLGQVRPLNDFTHSLYPVMGQEVAHRWGSGLRFVDPRSGAVSEKLLGRDGSHWAGWVDTDASVMDGIDWVVGDNLFTAVDDMRRYSTMDLYTMGALPVAGAKPFFFIDNARFIPNQYVGNQAVPAALSTYLPSMEYLNANGVELQATGEEVDLTIRDIVKAEGNRCPDPDHTQKTFRQAIVLVTRPGQTASQVSQMVDDLEQARQVWEDWWRDRTGNAITLCTDLAANCLHAELTLGGGEVDGKTQPGQEVGLMVNVGATGDNVHNAQVTARLLGGGAEFAELLSYNADVGEVGIAGSQQVRLPIKLHDDYACGKSLIVEVTVQGDNAPKEVEEYRLFPGYDVLYSESFDGDTVQDFYVNDDGLDSATSGAFERTKVELTCFDSEYTPARDATPAGSEAFITGKIEPLNGDTSLWTGSIDITGALEPEVRFAYWLDGPGGKLTIALSNDAKTYTTVKTYDEGYAGWVLGRADIVGTFEELPSKIWVRFIFEGNGDVEGGIDDLTVLDRAGVCAPVVAESCACSASGYAAEGRGTPMGALALGGLFALTLRRRKKGQVRG